MLESAQMLKEDTTAMHYKPHQEVVTRRQYRHYSIQERIKPDAVKAMFDAVLDEEIFLRDVVISTGGF